MGSSRPRNSTGARKVRFAKRSRSSTDVAERPPAAILSRTPTVVAIDAQRQSGTHIRIPSAEILNRLADNLRRFRHLRGYSQGGLGKLCGMQKSYIGSIEQGTVNVTLASLETLANGLWCTEADLLRRVALLGNSNGASNRTTNTTEIAPQREVAHAFGEVLVLCRRLAGISQEELAHRAGLDRTYPSLIERGKRQPTIGRLIAIGIALDIEPSTLVVMTIRKLPPCDRKDSNRGLPQTSG